MTDKERVQMAAEEYSDRYQRNAFGDMSQRGRIAYNAFLAGAAFRDAEIEELLGAFESYLHTMSAINANLGYQFTQPLINAHKFLDKFRGE